LVLIFQALSITQTTILTKQIDFKTKTKASVVSAVLSGVIGITMAYMGYGVWSLVGQRLSVSLIYTLCMWALMRWWPKLRFDKGSFSYMWGFGWKIMLSGLLNNIWNQMYQVVVGKCYSPETLGQYSRAKEYAGLFSSNFTAILQRVTYPALADVQDNQARMVAAYRKVIKVSMYITAVSMVFMAAVSEPLIYCMIGPQWKEAASYLPLICLSMSFYPLHAINLNMLQIQGRSDIYLYIEILKKIISIIPLFFGIFVGIFWMLWGTIVTGILSFFINSYYTGKKLNYTSWMQLRDIMPSYGLGLIVALTVYFLKYLPLSYFIVLLLQIIVGIVTILTVSRVSKMEEYDEFVIIAKGVVEKFYHFKK
jgi:O-antigen/teichoic acid export membrane protein